jgi:AcrR family transcriptional regulator
MVLVSTTPRISHRERLLGGLAAAVREKGLRQTHIADIVRHARTSRRTFYEHFADKDACYLAMIGAAGDVLLAAVEDAVDLGRPWDEQIDLAVDRYVEMLGVDPALTVSFFRDAPALGAPAAAEQRRMVDAFADLVVRLVESGGNPPVRREVAVMLVGGLQELEVHAVESGEEVATISPVAKDVLKAALDPQRRR